MSRSYKKTSYCGDSKGKKKKRAASHSVRRQLKKIDYLPRYNTFKKLYSSYEICDYHFIMSWEEFWDHKLKHIIYLTMRFNDISNSVDKKEEYKNWYKFYKRK